MPDETEKLFSLYMKQAEATLFSGWDFRYHTDTGRMAFTPARWNYYNVVLPELTDIDTLQFQL